MFSFDRCENTSVLRHA